MSERESRKKDRQRSGYARFERTLGWALLCIGAATVAFFAIRTIGELFWQAPIPVFLKAAICTLVLGLVVLYVSIIREQYHSRKKHDFKDIQE